VPDPVYTLSEPEHDEPRGCRCVVFRDGVEVATVYEHKDGRAFVSMTAIRWLGQVPVSCSPKGDGPLFYDFVSETACTAADTLPEVIARCERIIAWRQEQEQRDGE
jgi:hypothetical protein